MTDSRYSAALIKRHKQGLPIRILVNGWVDEIKPKVGPVLQALKASGIPMRTKANRTLLHWKTMIFHGLGRMQLSKANYTPQGFVPGHLEEGGSAKQGFDDEAILFLGDPGILASFVTQFENYWTDTSMFAEYSNSPGQPVRQFPVSPIDPAVNFHPSQDFNQRAVGRMVKEQAGIDVIEFRLFYPPAVDALIAAHQQGVRVRVIVEPASWNNPTFKIHKASIDRLAAAGVSVKQRIHPGLTHEALIVLHGLHEAIFGSSNLAQSGMLDHNIFFGPGRGPVLSNGQTAYEWFAAQFQRKWDNTAAFLPFTPR